MSFHKEETLYIIVGFVFSGKPDWSHPTLNFVKENINMICYLYLQVSNAYYGWEKLNKTYKLLDILWLLDFTLILFLIIFKSQAEAQYLR